MRDGLAQCLRAGTTFIGDIASEGQSYETSRIQTFVAVLFWEHIGLIPTD